MGPQLDEARLRQLLDDVTSGQPEAPPGRYLAVRRRVTRRRWAQAASSLVLVTAVAASAIGIGIGWSAGSTQAASGSRQVPSWALPWPDHRNGSVPQRVLDQAVIAWSHSTSAGSSSETPTSSVIWYVGQTVAHGQVVAVIFEVDSPAGPQLVAGWAIASEVMNGRSGSGPWVIYSVPAPPPNQRALAIGLNAPRTVLAEGQNPDNWVVELTAPTLQTFVMLIHHPAREIVAAYSTVGLLVRDVGQIVAPVRVSLQPGQINGRLQVQGAEPVGLPGSPASEVPELALPAPLTRVGGIVGTLVGQGDSTSTGDPAIAIRIIARCYGPAPLRIAVAGRGDGGPKMGPTLGTIPCNNGQHEIWLHGRQQRVTWLYVRTSDLTSWRVALVGH